jgi:hypothetical protein
MYKMSSILVLSAFVGLVLWSCAKSDPPEPKDKTPLLKAENYVFQKWEAVEVKLYVGSPNGGVDKSHLVKDARELFPTSFVKGNKIDLWKFDSLRIHQDTLVEYPIAYEANTFKFKVSPEDSLFRWNVYSKEWQFYGMKLPNKGGIDYLYSFYRFTKVRESIALGLNGKENGSLSDKDFFNDNPYRFASLKDMTSVTDTVLYCNVRYYYR